MKSILLISLLVAIFSCIAVVYAAGPKLTPQRVVCFSFFYSLFPPFLIFHHHRTFTNRHDLILVLIADWSCHPQEARLSDEMQRKVWCFSRLFVSMYLRLLLQLCLWKTPWWGWQDSWQGELSSRREVSEMLGSRSRGTHRQRILLTWTFGGTLNPQKPIFTS